MTDPDTPPTCPICGAAAAASHAPFCSRRCADVDLHRWLSGVYRVETDERTDDFPSDDTFSSPGA